MYCNLHREKITREWCYRIRLMSRVRSGEETDFSKKNVFENWQTCLIVELMTD